MRVTNHSGRGYGARHNDRNFGLDAGDNHIDRDKTKDNLTWHYYADSAPDMTFEDAERKFYAEHFATALDERNQKYINTRNYKLTKTMDDYYTSRKTCPEDVILQVGRKGETIPADKLMDIYADYMRWHEATYPNVQLISAALHVDEPDAAPHIHARQVWMCRDGKGNLCASQSGALREMGVERPDQTKPVSRYNNAKMTYTAACRAKMQAIAQAHGLTIETKPMEPGRAGLSLSAYKVRQDMEHSKTIKIGIERITETIRGVVKATPKLLDAISRGGNAQKQAAKWYHSQLAAINDAGDSIGIEVNYLLDDDYHRAERVAKQLQREYN